MEVTDSTKILLNRIWKFEKDNATKIIGYLLLNHTNQQILEYAFGSDKEILLLINEAKAYLTASRNPNVSRAVQQQLGVKPFDRAVSRPFSSPSSFRVPAPFLEPQQSFDQIPLAHNLDRPPASYIDLIGRLHDQADYDEQLRPLNSLSPGLPNKYYFPESAFAGDFGSRTNMRLHAGLCELPTKPCHYFQKGYCKNGNNCRFIHDPDSLSNIYNSKLNELGNEDYAFPPESLENLEMEIIELLKSKGGMPISIAALPMLYLEKYGKVLQADGYLTESQRHGKSGFSLTRLLAKYKNTIRLIDRPHGQHSVILAEDAPKYVEYKNDRMDQGSAHGSSHQIYLTFPADSAFTEDDVHNYFNQYGPVRDVRIPRQAQRMFGFVSFLYPETVKLILSKGHPHYIRGARVLVKPYKEKPKPMDKKNTDIMEPQVFYPSQFLDIDLNPNAMFHVHDNSGFMRRRLIDDHELAVELERRRLFDMQLTPKHLAPEPYFSSVVEEVKLPEDDTDDLVVSHSSSEVDSTARQTSDSCHDQHSDHIELPDSPFANSFPDVI